MIAAWMVEIQYWFSLTGTGSLLALILCAVFVLPLCFIYAEMTTCLLYTSAVLGDLTPVMGGYCDAPWDASLKQLPPNKNYLFSTVRNDGNIGSDYAPGMELSFDKEAYPYLTA